MRRAIFHLSFVRIRQDVSPRILPSFNVSYIAIFNSTSLNHTVFLTASMFLWDRWCDALTCCTTQTTAYFKLLSSVSGKKNDSGNFCPYCSVDEHQSMDMMSKENVPDWADAATKLAGAGFARTTRTTGAWSSS